MEEREARSSCERAAAGSDGGGDTDAPTAGCS